KEIVKLEPLVNQKLDTFCIRIRSLLRKDPGTNIEIVKALGCLMGEVSAYVAFGNDLDIMNEKTFMDHEILHGEEAMCEVLRVMLAFPIVFVFLYYTPKFILDSLSSPTIRMFKTMNEASEK